LACEDGAKRCPAGITDALGQVVVPYHIRNQHIFEIDHVILLQQGQCGLVVKVASLLLHRLVVAAQDMPVAGGGVSGR
jgi:hypothetical protein